MSNRPEEYPNRESRPLGASEHGVVQSSKRRCKPMGSPTDLSVVWEGSQFITHSLAIVNRELCSELIERGIDLGIRLYEEHEFDAGNDPKLKKLQARFGAAPSSPTQVHVRHQWPPSFVRPEQGKWVMIQPWEYGFILKSWLAPMREHVDEIWVPSRFVRQCYIDSGLDPRKVFVIPNGVDVQRFSPQAQPALLQTQKSFKFLFVGGTIPRKGIRLLLDTYRKTFTKNDDVCLVIKDMGSKGVYRGSTSRDEIELMMSDPHAPEIEYIDQHLCHEQVAGLYTAADVLVHPYHGEGFGMPIAESMACGRPAIVTGLGAATDFCNQENAYLIQATRHDMPTSKVSDEEACGFPWIANPDPDSLSSLMRDAVENPARRQKKGIAARQTIVEEFTWEQAVDMVQIRLEVLAQDSQSPETMGVSNSQWAHLGLSALKRALCSDPKNAALVCEIVGRLRQDGKIDEAAEILALSIARMPGQPDLKKYLRILSTEIGR
ncbi:MAG: glycosyltransferase involved in cell wall biosynthesis [Planctomycetota bacterium]|jgi:glycosyltransferase involved in cell wall biosynthesis